MPDTVPAFTTSAGFKTQILTGGGANPRILSASKNTATSFILYEDTTNRASSATDTGTIPTIQIMVGGNGTSDTTATNLQTMVVQVAALGLGFSATDVANINSDLTTFMTALGRTL